MQFKFWILILLMIPIDHSWSIVDGYPRIKMGPEDFEAVIEKKGENQLELSAEFIKPTMRWQREEDMLLLPKVIVDLKAQGKTNLKLTAKYQSQTRNLYIREESNRTTFYYSLFESDRIQLYQEENLVAEIYFVYKGKSRRKHHIDFSCARNKIRIRGLKSYPLSLQCQKITYGGFGNEKPILKIFFSSPHLTLPNGKKPPFVLEFNESMEIKQKLFNSLTKKYVTVKLSAKVPKHSKRLKTALGFGPYDFQLFDDGVEISKPTLPIMLYANLQLSSDKSFRVFDAFIWNKSYFNNAGLYYAYNNSMLDNRIIITPLLGFQSIEIYNHETKEKFSDIIGPQGFEIIYNHSFGIPGYIIGVGMFIFPESDLDYKNLWIRWGKGYFWELNYLSYRNEEEEAPIFTKSWGLSVGIPFFQLFLAPKLWIFGSVKNGTKNNGS